jgi:hypothetical protein
MMLGLRVLLQPSIPRFGVIPRSFPRESRLKYSLRYPTCIYPTYE